MIVAALKLILCHVLIYCNLHNGVLGEKRLGQKITIFRQTAANLRQIQMLKILILSLIPPKCGDFRPQILYF